jgi:hypothetical protein
MIVFSEVQGARAVSIAATLTVIDIVNTGPTGAHPCCVYVERSEMFSRSTESRF